MTRTTTALPIVERAMATECEERNLAGLTLAYHSATEGQPAFFAAFAHRDGHCGSYTSVTTAAAVAGAVDDLDEKVAAALALASGEAK